MRYIALLVGCCLLGGCPKTPETSRATMGCPMACDKLRSLSCSEGLSPHCLDLCREIVESGFLDVDFACIADADNTDELRKCGVCNP